VIKLTFAETAEIISGTLLDNRFAESLFEGVSIDSRTIHRGQIFIAIKGDTNDGHDHIEEAVARGCTGIIVNRDYPRAIDYSGRVAVVTVDDTYTAMACLAGAYHRRVKPTTVGVTGSNGKTTTKDLIYGMVRSKDSRAYRSGGNLNNLYGLPLSIFSMPAGSRVAVFEMGISTPGEMTRLTDIVTPDLAVITNVGATHLETLGTVGGVAEAKLELADAMDPDRPVLINADNDVLMQAASGRKRRFVTFGIKAKADFTAEPAGFSRDGLPIVKIDQHRIMVKLFGEHQIYNVLAAYAVGKLLGYDFSENELNDIDYSFAQYRGEIEQVNALTIIADCYNANPVSMKSGLESFGRFMNQLSSTERRAVAVIGDMLELGAEEEQYHRDIGRLLAILNFDFVLTVGERSRLTVEEAVQAGTDKNKIVNCTDINAAGKVLMKIIKRGDILYFKASRGIKLENLITLIRGTAFRNN
jgi:UDP-N-acetylmuramoyl-tripeptide--D-alanyl-D-alanine ligase